MRSMNTEDLERMFGQAKAITKATLCNKPNEILTNIIQRVEMESGSHEMEVRDKGESEVNKLSRTIGPRCNTMYSDSFILKHAAQYQTKELMITYCQETEHGGNIRLQEWNF